jgi:hypothetical protein
VIDASAHEGQQVFVDIALGNEESRALPNAPRS